MNPAKSNISATPAGATAMAIVKFGAMDDTIRQNALFVFMWM
jgi:hypothetical protein